MPSTRLRGSAPDLIAAPCRATAVEADCPPRLQPLTAVVDVAIDHRPPSAPADNRPAQPLEREIDSPRAAEPTSPGGESADELYAAFQKNLWLIRRILTWDRGLSSHDAEEVEQDIFIEMEKSWSSRQQTDARSTEAWIRTIVHRVALNHGRRSRLRPQTGFEQELFESYLAPGDRDPTLDEVIDNELQARMALALGKLPEPIRQAVILWSETDVTILEIAHALGCSPRTVTLRVRRALATLRQELMPLAIEGNYAPKEEGRRRRRRHRAARRPHRSVRSKVRSR
jgi:RNA polymerase sigma factor (sigma-70 family)